MLELQKHTFGLLRESLGLAFLLLALGVCGGDGVVCLPGLNSVIQRLQACNCHCVLGNVGTEVILWANRWE